MSISISIIFKEPKKAIAHDNFKRIATLPYKAYKASALCPISVM